MPDECISIRLRTIIFFPPLVAPTVIQGLYHFRTVHVVLVQVIADFCCVKFYAVFYTATITVTAIPRTIIEEIQELLDIWSDFVFQLVLLSYALFPWSTAVGIPPNDDSVHAFVRSQPEARYQVALSNLKYTFL